MKDKIKSFTEQISKNKKTFTLTGLALLFAVIIPVAYAFMNSDQKANAVEQATISGRDEIDSLTAVVGEESVTDIGNVGPGNSWPGEIVSSEISQIQPQREGVITEWRVRVGEQVSAGQVLGKISAPPATPELIKMLAEQTEAVTRAKAQASITDAYASKEQARFSALRDSIGSDTNTDLAFTALQSLRDKAEVKKQALRSFTERALAGHVATITTFSDWRYVRYGGITTSESYNQSLQNMYETSLITLVETLKRAKDRQIETVTAYFDLAVRFANSMQNDSTGFKTMTAEDQKDFLEFVAEYRDAQMAVADKETEYKIMLSEKASMLEKERSMAHVEADAAEASYKTVAGEINAGVYMYAPRSGSVSAIYKKVGDLVGPEMSVAVIAGHGKSDLVVRMRIPSNIVKPKVGDIVSVVRPGFPKDAHKAKMLGVGISLDGSGSYMADAVLLDRVDWPVEASVRVIASGNSNTPTIPLSSVWWYGEGIPHVWGASEAGRIFPRKVTLGRTLGSSVEIYDGLKNGERYVVRPTKEMQEDMLLQDVTRDAVDKTTDKKSGGDDDMGGMEM